MSELVEILVGAAVVGYVVGRQLLGEPLRGKRVVLLPVILTVVGFAELGGDDRRIRFRDVVLLLGSGAIAVVIGLLLGGVLVLEIRNGALWGQLPVRGLCLWLVLVASRLVVSLIALGLHARVAASGAALLFVLGLNRTAQAAVIALRARAAGVAFAPEQDGTSFLAGVIGPSRPRDRTLVGRRLVNRLQNRIRNL